MRLKLAHPVTKASAADKAGQLLPAKCSWDAESATALVDFEGANAMTTLYLR